MHQGAENLLHRLAPALIPCLILCAEPAGCTPTAAAPCDGPDACAAPGAPVEAEVCEELTTCEPGGPLDTRRVHASTHLELLSPARLSATFLQNQVNEAVATGRLILLMGFHPGEQAGSLLVEVGPGREVGECHAFDEQPGGPAHCVTLDDRTFTAEGIDVHLVMRDSDGEAALDVVLPASSVHGAFAPDGLSLEATIESALTLERANDAVITPLGTTLCGLISGATGAIGDLTDDCRGDPGTWPSPPDTTASGEPAYTIRLAVAAACVPAEPRVKE